MDYQFSIQLSYEQLLNLALQLATEQQKQLIALLWLCMNTTKMSYQNTQLVDKKSQIQQDFANSCSEEDLEIIDNYLYSAA
jgi:PIN domain